MMNDYAHDFAAFLRRGRIGSPEARIDIHLESPQYAPGALIRGSINLEHAVLTRLEWRNRSAGTDWRPVVVGPNSLFTIQAPAQQAVIELRAIGSDVDGEDLSAIADLQLVWPQGTIALSAIPKKITRYEEVKVEVSLHWIDEITIAIPGEQYLRPRLDTLHDGSAFELQLPTDSLGRQKLEIHWCGLDGNHGSEHVQYDVVPRAIEINLQPFAGGYQYQTRHGRSLELHLPGREPLPIPHEGVIEGVFLAPLSALVCYRDEGNQWQAQPIAIDAQQTGFKPMLGFTEP